MPQKPVTEQQILDAMEEYSEVWVEQLVRRAKNQRLALSNQAIVDIGEYLEMPELMDHIVAVRMEEVGPYDPSELNPKWPQRSVCEVMTPLAGARLMASTGAKLGFDELTEFVEYHLDGFDDDALEVCLAASRISREDAELLLGVYGYTRDKDNLLGRLYPGAKRAMEPANADRHKRKGAWKAVLAGVVAVGAAALALVGGVLFVAVFLAIALLAAFLSTSSSRSNDVPDDRSDYHRRVWADDHNYEADGDSDHNWEADGDRPW